MTEIERQPEDYQALNMKLGVIYGGDSELFSKRTLEYMRELVSSDFPAVEIPNAQHHVFLDQPLAFIDALRQMCKDIGA